MPSTILSPRAKLVDPLGFISKDWYRFFYNLDFGASGSTEVGQSFLTLPNPNAVTFVRINANNSVSALDAATFRSAIGAGSGNGSVSSVNVSGGGTGFTFSGGPITTSGVMTLSGILNVANGGTSKSSWSANGMVFASSSLTLDANTFVTYDGLKFRVLSKGSYLEPSLASGGFNISDSFTFNDGLVHVIGALFLSCSFVIHISSSFGLTSIPVFPNGSGEFNYMNPGTGVWSNSNASPTISFSQNGGDSYSVVLNSITGVGTVQRTVGVSSYTVSVQKFSF